MQAKYTVVFLLLAFACGFTSAVAPVPPWAFLWLWAAASFLLLAVGYAGAGPGLLLKRADGTVAPAAWLLFGPYFALNHLAFALARWAPGPPLHEIVPGLYLGRRLTGREARRFGFLSAAGVADLTAEFPEVQYLRAREGYFLLAVLDGAAPPLAGLVAAVTWLAERAGSGPVYVHCALGTGRSATVAVAYLLWSGQCPTFRAAYALVRRQRPGVRLNPAQKEVLRRFEEHLVGGKSGSGGVSGMHSG